MIKEIKAKSILIRRKRIDSWFITHYGMNLYRGCTHNCVYCDGRAESYNVQGEFGRDISVKINAPELLDKELDPKRKRKRKPMPKSFIMLGEGVCDSYQPAEKKYELTRKALELIYKYKYPVHILTKSTLIEKDLDLLEKINKQSKVLMSFSFSSVDEKLSKIFEPNVPPPAERLATIKKLKSKSINCGMFLMPVIPFVTDTPKLIDKALKQGKEAGIDFVIFSGMTLKAGKQKDHFIKTLRKHFPKLVSQYDSIYSKDSKWGESTPQYYQSINDVFNKLATLNKVSKRIPLSVYENVVSENDKIIIILEHLDYLLKLKGQKSPYGYAAYSLSKLKEPIANLTQEALMKINGIGPVTAKLIREVIDTGKCEYYEKLL